MNMRDYLRSDIGWQLRSWQLRSVLGLPEGRIPAETAVAETMVGNVAVWVLPTIKPGRRHHRVFCRCPDCGKALPAGRLHQHRTESVDCATARLEAMMRGERDWWKVGEEPR